MTSHTIVSHEEWVAARKAHLEREKAHTRAHDELLQQRRELPWEKVTKTYEFDTPCGKRTLSELFDGRSQLIVQHFMFAPGWNEGCPGCSFLADHMDGANLHLPHHDVTLLAVSRAPLADLLAFKQRMGWKFPWVSSQGSDFNFDYHVSFTDEQVASGQVEYNYTISQYGDMKELHGFSVFKKDPAGAIYHTYSTYGRGGDILLGAHNFLDLTPLGRNEQGTMDWVRHHDKYPGAQMVTLSNGTSPADQPKACCSAAEKQA